MNRSARKIGALLAVLAVVASGCSLLGGSGTMDVQAEFRRTFNLFPQSPVRVMGVKVGQVIDLETSPDSEVVTATLRLDDDIALSADTRAVVLTASLLGERYVQLVTGDAEEALADGDLIALEDTQVPFEFDEVLNGLNDFVGGLEEEEVGRLVTNLSDLLDGNGQQLGETIDAAAGAVGALKDNDEELIQLASAVADLNETLVTRDEELGELLDDWISVTDTLTSESTDLDGALDNLTVLTREIAELMLDHRETLSQDVDTLTRVGRTLDRNLDQFSTAILGAAELFRHAERVIDRDSNMLPLLNHTTELVTSIEESLINRLEGLCLGAGGDADQCSLDALQDILSGGGGDLCLPPLVECTEDSVTLEDAITTAIGDVPGLGDALLDRREQRRQESAEEDSQEEQNGPLGGLLGGGDEPDDSGGGSSEQEDVPPGPVEQGIDDALRGLGLLGEEDVR